MGGPNWEALADHLDLRATEAGLDGRRGRHAAGLSSRGEHTTLGTIVANAAGHAWTLTRRWEPQARSPRRPAPNAVCFRDTRLTERYVGVATEPDWFRTAVDDRTTDALVHAADRNRLGACSIELRDHLLTARYRAAVGAVPDLQETLAALAALAEHVDSDPADTLPDITREPLVQTVEAKRVTDVADVRYEASRLQCALKRPAGLRARFRSAPAATIDWARGVAELPSGEVPLTGIRQVALVQAPDSVVLIVLDLGGGIAFAGHCARPASGQFPDTADLSPPLVCAQARR